MTKFSSRLKELRLKNNLSRKELAKELGVSPMTIYKWENKIIVPTIENAAKVAMFFHVKVEYLIGNID